MDDLELWSEEQIEYYKSEGKVSNKEVELHRKPLIQDVLQ